MSGKPSRVCETRTRHAVHNLFTAPRNWEELPHEPASEHRFFLTFDMRYFLDSHDDGAGQFATCRYCGSLYNAAEEE